MKDMGRIGRSAKPVGGGNLRSEDESPLIFIDLYLPPEDARKSRTTLAHSI